MSRAVIISHLIGHVHTSRGLHIKADIDEHAYPRGIKVSDEDLAHIKIKTDAFHGEWNYTILPRDKKITWVWYNNCPFYFVTVNKYLQSANPEFKPVCIRLFVRAQCQR